MASYGFTLLPGEIVHVGGVPYRHVSGGRLEGTTDPAAARARRDAKPQDDPGHDHGADAPA